MTKLIALYSDRAGSGKSTTAQIMSRDFGFDIVRFADPVKAMAEPLIYHMTGSWDLTHSFMRDRDKKEAPQKELGGLSPRQIFQRVGEGARRDFGEDVFIKIALRKVNHLLQEVGPRGVVIDDLRKPEEAVAVRDIGGALVEVRPYVSDWAGPLEPVRLHFHTADTIVNTGEYENLRAEIRGMMGETFGLGPNPDVVGVGCIRDEHPS